MEGDGTEGLSGLPGLGDSAVAPPAPVGRAVVPAIRRQRRIILTRF